ncbi:hypothetical protein JCM11491_000341, partial [Sporobolomyces phaffii]
MRPSRRRRTSLPWLVALAVAPWLLALCAGATRPRPHILSKRNPTYSPLAPASPALAELATLSDLGAHLDFTDPQSFLSRVLVPRAVGSTNLSSLQREFEQKFTALGWHVEKDVFTASTPLGPQQFTNLVFVHDPDAARRFTLAAHLDSKYFPPAHPAHGKFVGATDSAVPCALLYDLAASLSPWLDARRERVVERDGGEQGYDRRQGETVQIVLFDGEEAFEEWSSVDSIYGARHLVEEWSRPLSAERTGRRRAMTPSPTRVEPKTELEAISHFVLLDLLGAARPVVRNFYANTAWLFDEFGHAERKLATAGYLAHAAAADQSFFVDRHAPQSWIGTIEDDHLPFLHQGVPVVHLISVPFPRVWHTLA